MYIVTGGAGFIGSNIVAALNREGITDILVVDNLETASKFLNLRDLFYADYMDKVEFRQKVENKLFERMRVEAIFHQGACSNTMEYNGRYMMDNNFTYSKILFHEAVNHKIPFVYASSAATYGSSTRFAEEPENEAPLNVYGYSKLAFDRYVMRYFPRLTSTVAGLRYFNVYGPRERHHKGHMASQVYQLYRQLKDTSGARLFEGGGGYENGGQLRDFIHVDDVVSVNLFLARGAPRQGVFNCGTGQARAFNDIANHWIRRLGRGAIQYVPMPDGLREKYQNFTQADMRRLRETGYSQPFLSLEEGIDRYFEVLQKEDG
ncbi:MAG: ADP-glyceromanno-heptose 6-epimerase [Magnetococcales bacterium]|nr:ADP-glyceromanno-heptose 6-epimerase [Magnetococcales bacterium]